MMTITRSFSIQQTWEMSDPTLMAYTFLKLLQPGLSLSISIFFMRIFMIYLVNKNKSRLFRPLDPRPLSFVSVVILQLTSLQSTKSNEICPQSTLKSKVAIFLLLHLIASIQQKKVI